ncbi:ABC-2 type transport system ATP-binding protein [Brevibacterium sp. 239c]|nr:ABC-2 type transport system ATP-binding protein [Brevibacterium sp. 239c]
MGGRTAGVAVVIEAHHLTKRYGTATVVDDLSFTVRSGSITGFLGPNGAGKSTTMRLILGLDRPSEGVALIDGERFHSLPTPARTVGVMLESGSRQPRLSARAHLSWQAKAARLPSSRVDEVLELTGLAEAARKELRDLSLGMRQRLGIASALLGDPTHLIMDEPINGLDPQGVLWARSLFQELAAQGRTVFISSHLLSEMEAVADRIIVIGQGRLIVDSTMDDLQHQARSSHTIAVSPQALELTQILEKDGARVDVAADDENRRTLNIQNRTASQVGEIAAKNGLSLHRLVQEKSTLEQAFMHLTAGALEYQGTGHKPPRAPVASTDKDGGIK